MFQQHLLDTISATLRPQKSLIDAIAQALDISYDAAHRRTSGKCKLSLDESVRLASFFNISLDRLYETTSQDIVAVEKTVQVSNMKDLETYLKSSIESLEPLLKTPRTRLFYSAKDIPIFYLLKGNSLTQFKIYAWLKFLDGSFSQKSFENFAVPVSVLKAAKTLGKLYEGIDITEIWDLTTINSTLKQIHFYYHAGQLQATTAIAICVELKILIETISNKLKHDTSNYQLYHNELLLMTNNVLVCTPTQNALYVPFSMLSYYKTSDIETCKQADYYLKRQLKNSILLNTAGEKVQHEFFNKLSTKINALVKLLEASEALDFQ